MSDFSKLEWLVTSEDEDAAAMRARLSADEMGTLVTAYRSQKAERVVSERGYGRAWVAFGKEGENNLHNAEWHLQGIQDKRIGGE